MTTDPSSPADFGQETQDEFADLARVVRFFRLFLGLGFLGAVLSAATMGGWAFLCVLIWALALVAGGGGIGFLFGIPKVLQTGGAVQQPPPPAGGAGDQTGATALPAASLLSYRQKVNTNLEEISDWLTKIIVGVSLIQLKTVPDRVWSLAGVISGGMGATHPSQGFGVALIVYFGVSGFLFGYLMTRLYIQGALARAERGIEIQGLLGERQLRETGAAAAREVSQAIQNMPGTRDLVPPSNAPVDDELRELCRQYLSVETPDWADRVRRKNDLAAEMAAHVIKRGISRDLLVSETNEGLVMALAAAVQFAPEQEDTRRLIAASKNAHRLHVQYRFVLAFRSLFERGYVSATDKAAISEVLNRFETRADPSLRLAIAGLRRQLA